MNELRNKTQLALALGAVGPINNDRQYWTAVLTALNNGVYASANNESEFAARFAKLLPTWTGNLSPTQAVVSNGEAITGTGGTFTPVVANGAITGGTWTPE